MNDTDLLPWWGYPGIEHAVERVAQILGHDDGAVDGQLEVVERVSDGGDHALHAVDFLSQEDVHGLQGAHLLQPPFDLVRDVVVRQLLQHVVGEAVHHRLTRLTAATAAVFRLDTQDAV